MATQGYKRICTVCGKEYNFCSDCRQYALQPAWKNIYHDENCMEIAHVLVGVTGSISMEEAKERLLKCDLSKKDTFNEIWRKPLEELLDSFAKEENKKNFEDEKKVEESIEVNIQLKKEEEPKKTNESEESDKTNEVNITSDISNFRKKSRKKK